MKNSYLKYITIAESLVILGLCWLVFKEPSRPIEDPKEPIEITSELSVTPKTSSTQPDLEVSQKYTALVNGKKVEVPVKNAAPASVSPAATGATNITASLRQEVDVTPMVNLMVPKWELGVGLGKQKDSEIYIPLSVQRNYEFDKAIQFELHIDPRDQKINGVEIQHKWRF